MYGTGCGLNMKKKFTLLIFVMILFVFTSCSYKEFMGRRNDSEQISGSASQSTGGADVTDEQNSYAEQYSEETSEEISGSTQEELFSDTETTTEIESKSESENTTKTSGGKKTYNDTGKHFTFIYPNEWDISSMAMILAVYEPVRSNTSYIANVTFHEQEPAINYQRYSLEEYMDLMWGPLEESLKEQYEVSNFKITSCSNKKLAGIDGKYLTYEFDIKINQKKVRLASQQYMISTAARTYTITASALKPIDSATQKNFDMIFNSIQVK